MKRMEDMTDPTKSMKIHNPSTYKNTSNESFHSRVSMCTFQMSVLEGIQFSQRLHIVEF